MEKRPANIYLNQKLTDEDRRQRLFEGDIFIFSNINACAALCNHAMDTLREGFDTPNPETAFLKLPIEDFVRKVEWVKNRFTNGLRSKELLRDYAKEMGTNPDDYYFGLPRIRIVPRYDYLHSGVSYAYSPHRDTWYGGVDYQINHWMPVMPITPAQTMAIYPHYFNKHVENSSKDFDIRRWYKVERAKAVDNIKEETRFHPQPLKEVDQSHALHFGGNAGDMMVFSGSHLHGTVPNRSNTTRFSIDFRFFHIDDIKSDGRGKIKPPENMDAKAAGKEIVMDETLHLGNFSTFLEAKLK